VGLHSTRLLVKHACRGASVATFQREDTGIIVVRILRDGGEAGQPSRAMQLDGVTKPALVSQNEQEIIGTVRPLAPKPADRREALEV